MGPTDAVKIGCPPKRFNGRATNTSSSSSIAPSRSETMRMRCNRERSASCQAMAERLDQRQGDIQPPEFIRQLFGYNLGVEVPYVSKTLHCLTGVVLYPFGIHGG
jgi:hypothetical protein